MKNRNENYRVNVPGNIRRMMLGSRKYKRRRDRFVLLKKIQHSAFYNMLMRICMRKIA